MLYAHWTIPPGVGYTVAHSESDVIRVTRELAIPRAELDFRASRSGGAGGQHVNTSSTRIELLWDLQRSAVLTDEVRARLAAKLVSRLSTDGVLRIVASERRSQTQNKLAAEERFAELLRRALIVPKPRRPTKPSRAAKERRLTEKKKRAERKRERRSDFPE